MAMPELPSFDYFEGVMRGHLLTEAGVHEASHAAGEHARELDEERRP